MAFKQHPRTLASQIHGFLGAYVFGTAIANAGCQLAANRASALATYLITQFKYQAHEDPMTHYQSLSSEKYYHESLVAEVKEIRKQKNRDAARAFMQFLFVLAVMFGVWFAIQQMPNWLPTVTAYMDQAGITEVLHNWLG